MAVNMLMLIQCPLRYPMIVTNRRVLFIIVLIWIVSILLNTIHWLIDTKVAAYVPDIYLCIILGADHKGVRNNLLITVFGCHVPCLVIQLYTHIKIYAISQSHRRKIAPEKPSGDENVLSVATKRMKEVKSILIVTGIFAFSWTPLLITGTWSSIGGSPVPSQLNFIAFYTVFSSSFLNWLIYTKTSPPYRSAQSKVWQMVKQSIKHTST